MGRATVRAFAARGYSVGLLSRGRDGLEAAAAEVEAAGTRALVLPTDVADAEAVEAAAEQVEAQPGPIDVWVNNAMVSVFAFFTDIESDEFRRITDVTYHGYVHGTRAALRRDDSPGPGRGGPGRVRPRLPGDPLPKRPHPVPPVYQPELAADAVVAMAEHPRREMWLTERTVLAIVGNALAPGFMDPYLGRTNVAAQQADAPADPQRPTNLWAPAITAITAPTAPSTTKPVRPARRPGSACTAAQPSPR